MRFLIVLAALAAMTVSVSAQPPKEVTATDGVQMHVGQSRTFEFDQPVAEFKLTVNGVVSVMPLTDRTFAIYGLAPGEVLAVAYGPNNKTVHHMTLKVLPTPLVRIYGGDRRYEVNGYAGYQCWSTGCSRANPDVRRTPDRTIVTETERNQNGDAVTISREYR